jgi:NADH:ubiquinone oxidoreductase subunit 3 (subunit A)
METKDRQIRFWQILAGVTLVYVILAVILLIFHPFSEGSTTQSILGYVIGGVSGTWLVIAPIAYLIWVKPSQKPVPSETPAKDERAKIIQPNPIDAKDLKMRYRFNIGYLAFFIIAMFLQLLAYVFRSGDSIFIGFWSTFIILVLGLANLATIIHQSRLGWVQPLQEEAKRGKRLNQWYILFLVLAVVWLIAVWGVFPQMIPDLSQIMVGMFAAIWLILAALSYLLYVIKYPQAQ